MCSDFPRLTFTHDMLRNSILIEYTQHQSHSENCQERRQRSEHASELCPGLRSSSFEEKISYMPSIIVITYECTEHAHIKRNSKWRDQRVGPDSNNALMLKSLHTLRKEGGQWASFIKAVGVYIPLIKSAMIKVTLIEKCT